MKQLTTPMENIAKKINLHVLNVLKHNIMCLTLSILNIAIPMVLKLLHTSVLDIRFGVEVRLGEDFSSKVSRPCHAVEPECSPSTN